MRKYLWHPTGLDSSVFFPRNICRLWPDRHTFREELSQKRMWIQVGENGWAQRHSKASYIALTTNPFDGQFEVHYLLVACFGTCHQVVLMMEQTGFNKWYSKYPTNRFLFEPFQPVSCYQFCMDMERGVPPAVSVCFLYTKILVISMFQPSNYVERHLVFFLREKTNTLLKISSSWIA